MELKATHSLLALIVLSSMANAAPFTEVDAGTIHFDGQVIDTPCIVAVNSRNQTITLPDVSIRQFYEANNPTPSIDRLGNHEASFTIKIEQCSPANAKTVSFKFNGATVPNKSNVLINTATESPATGIGLVILGSDKIERKAINTAYSETMIIPAAQTEGEQTFYADYISTQSEIASGDVKATATLDVAFN